MAVRGLQVSPEEEAIVRAILQSHLPPGARAWVFGSRAGRQCKPWSDLDLALEGPEPLGLDVLAALAEAFAESALPWKVDLVDLAVTSPAFRQRVADSSVPL